MQVAPAMPEVWQKKKLVLRIQGGEGIEQTGENLRDQRVCDGLGRTQGLAFAFKK